MTDESTKQKAGSVSTIFTILRKEVGAERTDLNLQHISVHTAVLFGADRHDTRCLLLLYCRLSDSEMIFCSTRLYRVVT